MEVSKPFAVLRIGKMGVGPVMDLFVHILVATVMGNEMSQERCENCLVMWPPELHVVPILLRQVYRIDHESKKFRHFQSPNRVPTSNRAFDTPVL